MFQVTVRFVLLLGALTLALCGLTRARPYDAAPVRALLDAPNGCESPCWSGIRPGVTTLDEAVTHLRANPWVRSITPQISPRTRPASGAVVWTWNGTQPFSVDSQLGGSLAIQGGVVTRITLPTRVTVGETWLALGPAARGRVTHAGYPYERYDVDYLGYPERGLTVQVIVERPVTVTSFWSAPATYIIQPLSANISTPFRMPLAP